MTCAADGKVRIWKFKDSRSQPLVLEAHTAAVRTAAWSPRKQWLATSDNKGDIIIWNTATWKPEARLVGDGEPIWRLTFSPDGQTLASCGESSAARLWDESGWMKKDE